MTKNRIIGIVVGVCVVVAVVLVLVFTLGRQPAMEYTIGITQIVTHPALDSAREGFIDALAEEGFIEGENVDYILRNAEGDMSIAASIAEYFVSIKVDLILSIATQTSQAVVAAVNETDIPVVFNSVTEPQTAGLVASWDEPGGQVTGVSDMAPVEPQIDLIMDIAPNTTKLGVIYNAGEVNSAVQVDMLYDIIDDFGLTVVEAAVASTADVPAAAQSLVGRVDAIWVPADNTAVAAFESIVSVGEENDIPVFAADVATVERGAIGCWGMDYYYVGYTSGEMAVDILEGADPATMPVQTAPANLLYLNLSAAERMEVTIPQELIDIADVKIED